jgi:hypothetical protein
MNTLMNTAKNDITGDTLSSKKTNEKFRNNYDLIDWGKKKNTLEDDAREKKKSSNCIGERTV